MSKNVTKLISPRVLCTSITNRVLIWFDRFIAYYNCISEDVTKFLTPRVVCTNIKKRVLSWFDRFSAYYNCMNKNVTKLISPRVLCSDVTNRLLSWFESFTAYHYSMSKNVTKSYLHEFCAQVSQNVFLADLIVLRFNTTVWAKMSQFHISTSYVHNYHKSCF